MKKFFNLTIVLLLSVISTGYAQLPTISNDLGDAVYVCTGPKAKKYHSSSSCSGLNKCSVRIVRVSKSEAQAKGYTACRKCH